MKILIILHSVFAIVSAIIGALDMTPEEVMTATGYLFAVYIPLFFICLPLMAGDTEPAEKE